MTFESTELQNNQSIAHPSLTDQETELDQIAALKSEKEQARIALLNHPIYQAIDSISRLRLFMHFHVWAVWSFMSLVKRLQRDLTSVQLPWIPPKNSELARFINEIVLGEESDRMPDHTHKTHFELYILAMREVGACPEDALQFVEALANRGNYAAPEFRMMHPAVGAFVDFDIKLAMHGGLAQVAGSFLWGREDLIPEMFQRLLPSLKANQIEAPYFEFYVRRHIEIDGEEHGPLAQRMMDSICISAQDRIDALHAGIRGLNLRRQLWDAVVEQF